MPSLATSFPATASPATSSPATSRHARLSRRTRLALRAATVLTATTAALTAGLAASPQAFAAGVPMAARTAAMPHAAFMSSMVHVVLPLRGTRYVWAGTTPRGFDCSGFTQYVYRRLGVWLPRTSQQQYNAVPRVSPAQARPGDLIFFHSSSGAVYHVGIYAGRGLMYDSPRPGQTVGLHKIFSSRVSYGRVH